MDQLQNLCYGETLSHVQICNCLSLSYAGIWSQSSECHLSLTEQEATHHVEPSPVQFSLFSKLCLHPITKRNFVGEITAVQGEIL